MSVTALASKKSSDERAALRAAVGVAAAVKADLAKRHASLEAASEHAARARERSRVATAAIAKAREEHVARVTRALEEGREPPRSTTVQDARGMETDALDELNAATAAVEAIAADVRDLEVDVEVAGRAVDAALAQTLIPVARDLLLRARDNHLKLLVSREALHAVTTVFNHWNGGAEITHAANRVGSANDEDARAVAGIRQEWENAVAALRENADAPLPE
jgi:hypothetical protein